MPAIPPFAVQSGEGRTLRTPTDDRVTVQADTAMTNGSLSVLELVVEPKSGPALHTHLREDELWFVLEGEFRFKAGDSRFQVSTALGFVLTFLVASLTGLAGGAPFTALQILFVNLVMDGPPAMSLGVDPVSPDAMTRRPGPVPNGS